MRKKKNHAEPVEVNGYSEEAHLIYGQSQDPRWDYSHHLLPPISSSATYRLDSAQRGAQGFTEFAHSTDEVTVKIKAPIYIYDRLGEPNKDMLEENLAYAEGGDIAVTFASGMAAISGHTGHTHGHRKRNRCPPHTVWLHVLAAHKLVSPAENPLQVCRFHHSSGSQTQHHQADPRAVYGIACQSNVAIDRPEGDRADSRRGECQASEGRENIHGCRQYVRNPLLPAAARARHRLRGAFADQGNRRIRHGYWRRGDRAEVEPRHADALSEGLWRVLSAKSAWPVLVQGLPSLWVRMRQMQTTALKVAEFLTTRPEIECVHYPGLQSYNQAELARRQMVDYDGNFAPGAMIYFVMRGGAAREALKRAEHFINDLATNAYCITLAVSLGNIRTLIEHPRLDDTLSDSSGGASQKGLDPGGIRLAIGLEKPGDIIRDLTRSLEKVKA